MNGTPVFLTTPAGSAELGYQPDKQTFVARYTGKKKMLRQYFDLLDKNPDQRAVVLFHEDLPGLWADFQACFQWIEAAGGYVLNAQKMLLVFFRRNSWDLPKGKIDPGETPEQAAVREVQEETGLFHVQPGPLLGHTLHTYLHKGQRVLKKTWWYAMTTTDSQVTPQTEEDIEQIEWVEPGAWLASGVPVYGSIREVIEWGMKSEE